MTAPITIRSDASENELPTDGFSVIVGHVSGQYYLRDNANKRVFAAAKSLEDAIWIAESMNDCLARQRKEIEP